MCAVAVCFRTLEPLEGTGAISALRFIIQRARSSRVFDYSSSPEPHSFKVDACALELQIYRVCRQVCAHWTHTLERKHSSFISHFVGFSGSLFTHHFAVIT